ncbi:MAG TPA: hypothetical protein VII30_03830 [Gemmatimonadaceae bacterium]
MTRIAAIRTLARYHQSRRLSSLAAIGNKIASCPANRRADWEHVALLMGVPEVIRYRVDAAGCGQGDREGY